MTRPLVRLLSLGVALMAAACTPSQTPAAPDRPTSVIVLIADGAGVAHWTLARFAAEHLAVERMPVAGLMHTRGSNHEVTGSAPGASAIATGVRTFMGAIAVGPDSLPRETVLEAAHARGWATGLITTTWLMDATPAAFGSHVVSRRQMDEIFRQMTSLPVDVLMGGGNRLFPLVRERNGVDLLTPALERYTYLRTAEELASAVDTASMVLGLFAEGDMPRAGERSPSLSEMTRAALRILERDPDGLFLMVENEGSDTEAHRNSPRDVLTAEMLSFDDAVGVALDFQESHPGTLVLVAADHETGGVDLPYASAEGERELTLRYSTQDHTGAMVPIFASGPGAERFGGVRDNDQVGRTLMGLVKR